MHSHLLRPVTIADSSGSDDPSLFHKTIKTPLLGYQNSHLQTNKVLCLLAEYCGMELLILTYFYMYCTYVVRVGTYLHVRSHSLASPDN